MANTIILKKSSVAGKVPLSTDLQVGELAVNLADGLLYSKTTDNSVIQVGGSGGADVFPRYIPILLNDGTTIVDADEIPSDLNVTLQGIYLKVLTRAGTYVSVQTYYG
jgi:hypothetical protein